MKKSIIFHFPSDMVDFGYLPLITERWNSSLEFGHLTMLSLKVGTQIMKALDEFLLSVPWVLACTTLEEDQTMKILSSSISI